MTRTIHRLGTVKINALKTPGYYGDGGGLYLRVRPGGSKSWVFRFTVAGRKRDGGLGRYPTITLAKARELAEECRRLVACGVDPVEQRREEREVVAARAAKAMMFEACAKAYIEAHEAGWKSDKHHRQWRASLGTYVFPIIGVAPVDAIDTTMVLTVLTPIWNSKPETASRVRGRIELVLDWAKARGYRDGENPARWRGHLQHMLAPKKKLRQVEHLAALPYDEIGELMAELRERTSIAARALEFLILTAARTNEALGATWDEIDLHTKKWTIPAQRMKGGREHRVPLCPRAVHIVKEMAEIRLNEYVFPGIKPGRGLSHMTMLMMLRRMGYADCTIHGFRSTFRDWAAECTTVPREIAEAALAHVTGSAVERAYRRGDALEKRRVLMEQWAVHCQQTPSAKVVQFRKPNDMTQLRG